ncbi:hypothetical protein Hanom_Chr10g00901791 [Helianthus anomalus]
MPVMLFNYDIHCDKMVIRICMMFSSLQTLKKQTVFFWQTEDVWSTFSIADVCRCVPQTADILPLKKQTTP